MSVLAVRATSAGKRLPTGTPRDAAARLDRRTHPMAWWVWAIGLALTIAQASDAIATGLLVGAIALVVALCHDRSQWARAFPAYLVLGIAIVALRVVFHILVGIKTGGTIVLPLPRVRLPEWTGIVLLGPVSAEGIVHAATAGLALATLVLCFGAAVALTDPKRALRSLPAPLHLLGTASVIAFTLAPQLVESWRRVRRAQELRGQRLRGPRLLRASTMPVLHDALDRSLQLAASMDSRGYARVRHGSGNTVTVLLLTSLLAAAIGTYALLDGTMPAWAAPVLLPVSAAIAAAGATFAGRRLVHSRYRPERWGMRETAIAGSGLVAAAIGIAIAGLDAAGTPLVNAQPIWVLPALVACAPVLLARRAP